MRPPIFALRRHFYRRRLDPYLQSSNVKCQINVKIQMSKLKGLKRSDPFKTKTDIVFRSEGLTFATSQD